MKKLALCAILVLGACHQTHCWHGEDMAWLYSTLITVKDSHTLAFIPDPAFANDTSELTAKCFSMDYYADLAGPCVSSWSIYDGTGDYTLEVSAPGYATKSLAVGHDYTLEGCPAQHEFEAEVDLDPL